MNWSIAENVSLKKLFLSGVEMIIVFAKVSI